MARTTELEKALKEIIHFAAETDVYFDRVEITDKVITFGRVKRINGQMVAASIPVNANELLDVVPRNFIHLIDSRLKKRIADETFNAIIAGGAKVQEGPSTT